MSMIRGKLHEDKVLFPRSITVDDQRSRIASRPTVSRPQLPERERASMPMSRILERRPQNPANE